MKVQIKKEFDFSPEDVTRAIMIYLNQTQNIPLDSEFKIDFNVVNKPYPCGVHDVCDRHEFDGVKVVVKT